MSQITTSSINIPNGSTTSTTTVGAAGPTGIKDLYTLPLGTTAGTYAIESRVAAFNAATPAGAGYQVFGSVRTDGATATLVGTPDFIVNEEAALNAADIDLVVSGNNAIIRVTGVIALTINWVATSVYTKAV